MPIEVQYCADTGTKKTAAFYQFYRARNAKVRFFLELAVCVLVPVIVFVLIRFFATYPVANTVFIVIAILWLYAFGRLLRAGMFIRRAGKHKGDPERTYRFMEEGFLFGPTDEAGTMVEARYRELNAMYETDDCIYLLLKNRANWATLKKSMFTSGTPDELRTLILKTMPARKYYDQRRRKS